MGLQIPVLLAPYAQGDSYRIRYFDHGISEGASGRLPGTLLLEKLRVEDKQNLTSRSTAATNLYLADNILVDCS